MRHNLSGAGAHGPDGDDPVGSTDQAAPAPFDPQICDLCWETFENADLLAAHVADEEARTYGMGGLRLP